MADMNNFQPDNQNQNQNQSQYSYGYNADYTPGMPPMQPEQKGMSIASLVLGICGFIAWCIPLLGYPVTIVGIVLGAKGMKKGGKGMAIAGIICSSISLVLTLINSIAGAFMAVGGLTNMF